MNSNVKTIIFWVVLVCVAVLLVGRRKEQGTPRTDRALNFSEFLTEVEAGNVKDVTINGSDVKGDFMNGRDAFHTVVPANYPKLFDHVERQEGRDDLQRQQFQRHGFPFW